ncbi:hypothetical protein LTR62_002912 [Meristemomyces frigidus]|uniref:mRNA-capping enzyme subunit alpha n=1 Tax=Meristemomyces frigidus TaxID=1508187 RepID=A0AAN7TXW2_9PEZI|nr:hypothetical protein LTR62_002912 [Meristemomyces frigidus]
MGSSVNLSAIGSRLDGDDATFQRESVADLLGRTSLGFPGAQPVSFAKQHLRELRERDYFMCEKTDGIRCLLFLTQIPGEYGPQEAQFLIDRKNDYYFIRPPGGDGITLTIPTPPPKGAKGDFNVGSFHLGTLLDGEIVKQRLKDGTERITYLMFDILALDGENITTSTFDKRLAKLGLNVARPFRKFAAAYPQDVGAFPLQLDLKEMQFPYVVAHMFEHIIPTLPHGNDGLIFTCVDTQYVSGTDPHIVKWKPPQENTIDFKLVLGDFPIIEDEEGSYPDWDAQPEMELHVNHGGGAEGGYQYFAAMAFTAAEWSACKSLHEILDGRIIECFRDPDTGAWRPKLEHDGAPRFRDDKTDANHISTVNSVLQSIKDAITEQDLLHEATEIKVCYKKRLAEKAKKQAARDAGMKQQAAQRAQQAKVAPQQQQQKAQVAENEEEDDGPKYHD